MLRSFASSSFKVARNAGNVRSFHSASVLMNGSFMNQHLSEVDPEMHNIIEMEKKRQRESIVLIPSENFTSQSVLDALGSIMQNKYSEGYPGARYYGGNEYIDMSESLCQQRALKAFNLDPAKWGVNVQALSGSPANLYAYSALLKPHDRIMGLDLPHGGHLSHGYQTPTKKISNISVYFETFPYRLNEETGLIDYDSLEKSAEIIRPKLIIAGASAYSRNYDYKRMRTICDKIDAILLSDMAHISGMVAAGLLPSPFDHSDIVTTTTHKSLRGPRGAMIFYRKGLKNVDKNGKEIMYNYETPINFSVFPGHQGGPHNHTISALSVALKQALSNEFKEYQRKVLSNNAHFAKILTSLGYKLVSGGTDNHLILVDLKPNGIDGARVERVLELANIACNKNTVPGDKSAMVPGGIRVGTPAMTTRGFTEKDFEQVAIFIDRGVKIGKKIDQTIKGKSTMKDFKALLEDGGKSFPEIQELKQDVVSYASKFPAIAQ